MTRARKRIRIIFMLMAATIVYYLVFNIMLAGLYYIGTCRLPKGWQKEAFNAKTRSDMSDWSFDKIIHCPPFSLHNIPLERQTIFLECDNDSARISTRTTKSSSDIFTVPFRDQCLVRFIDNCCLNGRAVPNVVHYVWYNKHQMDFVHFLSFLSAVRFVQPCLILIHGPFLPYGDYWDYFVHVFPNIVHVKRNHTTTVGSNKLAYPEHGSDVMRIEALNVYGGLYLDWDEIVLRQVDNLRDYPVTMGIEVVNAWRQQMGSQFVMAKRGAAFLHLWMNSYETNYRDDWDYNALEVPFKLARQLPDLIHIEGNRFTRPNGWQYYLLFERNYNWSDNYAMHLYSRQLQKKYKYKFDEESIGLLNITIGSVARHILFGNKELCVVEYRSVK